MGLLYFNVFIFCLIWTWHQVSMQSRWRSDKYLSYLSSPPLLHCCSSLWSPVRQREFRPKPRTQHKQSGRKEETFGHGSDGRSSGNRFEFVGETHQLQRHGVNSTDGWKGAWLPPRSTNQAGQQWWERREPQALRGRSSKMCKTIKVFTHFKV